MLPFHQKMSGSSAGERLGHERQLHERPDANVEEEVVEQVHVLPVVARAPLLVLEVDAHVVVEEAVEPQVLEAKLSLDETELRLPVGPQALVGSTSTDALPKSVRERAGDAAEVGLDHARLALVVLRAGPPTRGWGGG